MMELFNTAVYIMMVPVVQRPWVKRNYLLSERCIRVKLNPL